jgi:hypothetical protein
MSVSLLGKTIEACVETANHSVVRGVVISIEDRMATILAKFVKCKHSDAWEYEPTPITLKVKISDIIA